MEPFDICLSPGRRLAAYTQYLGSRKRALVLIEVAIGPPTTVFVRTDVLFRSKAWQSSIDHLLVLLQDYDESNIGNQCSQGVLCLQAYSAHSSAHAVWSLTLQTSGSFSRKQFCLGQTGGQVTGVRCLWSW